MEVDEQDFKKLADAVAELSKAFDDLEKHIRKVDMQEAWLNSMWELIKIQSKINEEVNNKLFVLENGKPEVGKKLKTNDDVMVV